MRSLPRQGPALRWSCFMRLRRRLYIVLGVLLFGAAIALAVVLRRHAPPEPARLLPGADSFIYVNLKWIRRAHVTGQLPDVPHDPEYEQFLEATGFHFERDLEQAAFAIHYPATRASQLGEPRPLRFSEVFIGQVDNEKLHAYLRKLAASVDNYESIDIYNIPLEGRTLRVAILAVDTVAASNHDDPQVIRGIIKRSRKLASPFGGPALLRRYYKYVPIASLGWAILKVDPKEGLPGRNALSFLFTTPATVVASARYIPIPKGVHFRAEAFTGSNDDAQRLTEQLGTFLQLFHSAEGAVSPSGNDPDVKAFFDGLKVERSQDRAVLTATVPPGFLRKAIAEPAEAVPEPAARVPPRSGAAASSGKNQPAR